jgi:hypothetical protein
MVLVPVLVILTLLLAVPGTSQSMKYITPADFPPPGGLLTISEDTTLQVGAGEKVTINFNITLSGVVNFFIENDGQLDVESFSLKVYGGTVIIHNRNILQGNEWDLLDQFDGTHISNTHSIDLNTLKMVANGALGLIELQNTGTVRTGTLFLDANYGGQITIDTRNGRMNTGALFMNASGSSHGVESKITILGSIQRVLFLPLILKNP